MEEQLSHDVAAIGIRLLDDAHVAWVAAQNECTETLHRWFDAPRLDRAYYGYRAALDREEAAARDLQRLSDAAAPCRALLAAD